jgi:hypothetical protein
LTSGLKMIVRLLGRRESASLQAFLHGLHDGWRFTL